MNRLYRGLLAVLIIGGALGYARFKKSYFSKTNTPVFTSSAAPLAHASTQEIDDNEVNNKKNYSEDMSIQNETTEEPSYIGIKVDYQERDKIPAEANEIIEAHLADLIAFHKKEAEERYQEEANNPLDELEITVTVAQADQNYVSAIFNLFLFSNYFPHPSHWWTSLNYDLKNRKVITLADLFPHDPLYLEKIAFLCRKQLLKQLAEEQFDSDHILIHNGTEPTLDHFNCFSFTPETIEIFFQQHQVCSYSGMPTVTLNRKDVEQLNIKC